MGGEGRKEASSWAANKARLREKLAALWPPGTWQICAQAKKSSPLSQARLLLWRVSCTIFSREVPQGAKVPQNLLGAPVRSVGPGLSNGDENKPGGSLGTSHHNDSHQAGLIWLQPRFMHSSNSSDIAVGQSLFSPQIHPLPFSNSLFYYTVHLSGISNSMLRLLAAWQVSKKAHLSTSRAILFNLVWRRCIT